MTRRHLITKLFGALSFLPFIGLRNTSAEEPFTFQHTMMMSKYFCLDDIRSQDDLERLLENAGKELTETLAVLLKDSQGKRIDRLKIVYRNIPHETLNPDGNMAWYSVHMNRS